MKKKKTFTVSEITLHFQDNLVDSVFKPVDDLTAVFSHVILGNVSHHQGGIFIFLLLHKDAVLEASVGLLVESH